MNIVLKLSTWYCTSLYTNGQADKSENKPWNTINVGEFQVENHTKDHNQRQKAEIQIMYTSTF